MEQLAAIDVEPRDQDSTAKSIATLKKELVEEKLAQEKAKTDTGTLTQAVEEMKKALNQLIAHVPYLETQVKNLNDKIADLNTKLRVRELSLERTTAAKDEFQG
jgi:septal ring factor EnvC (AmiA/AmiB activator)